MYATGMGRVKRVYGGEILPEEILMDASNVAALDVSQFEGRVERPVGKWALGILGSVFLVAALVFGVRLVDLQITRGVFFAEASNNNRLSRSVVFAERGIIHDRTGLEIAWNEAPVAVASTTQSSYPIRVYTELPGLAHVLGFVRYPRTDKHGLWWRTETVGVSGAEQVYDTVLAGVNGSQIVEVDAQGSTVREQLIERAVDGEPITLSIDAEVQSALHKRLTEHVAQYGFLGGASIIMDVHTGEILALTSIPEFDSNTLTNGTAAEVAVYANDIRTPFLDRAVSGQYTPGSIVKPMFAAAALSEGIITPEKKILSIGYISIPNPYNPSLPTIMRDWKAHGWTDVREAIAVSSDVYFYSIGGGYESQAGLGIGKIEEWAHEFGFGELPGSVFSGEVYGVIPTPRWKEEMFAGDTWRIGDTYNTSIGQYGFQITPMQAVRATAAIANDGELLTPQLVRGTVPSTEHVDIVPGVLQVVREGMRLAVTSSDGTARSLNMGSMEIAGKTGTAEVGSKKQWMNSWVIGFWPASDPQYAFATVLEKAPAGTLSGAAPAMRPFFEWLSETHPEYATPLTSE